MQKRTILEAEMPPKPTSHQWRSENYIIFVGRRLQL